MLADLAYLGLVAGFVWALLGAVAGFAGGHSGHAAWIAVSRRALVATALFVIAATGALWVALLQGRFDLRYVVEQTESALPVFYKFAALWSGQQGSLLFWAFILSAYALTVNGRLARRLPRIMPWANGVFCVNLAFFLLLCLVPANPFARLPVALADGSGLNPLLQNYWMVIHPVMLYLGYVGLTAPFALAVGALATGQLDRHWVRLARRWTLIPWLFLSVGILMGSQWAYMELGWGGYWAWDPVENVSLLPWLTATAFLHSIIVQELRGTMKFWNLAMIGLTYFLILLGTLTTRSEIVASVHSFARSSIGLYFVGLLILILGGFLYLLWARRRVLQETVTGASWLSRESAFLGNNWLFAGLAFATLWGTYFPVFSEVVTGDQIAVAAPYFEKVNGPLFLLLVLLMGIGPLLRWGHTSWAALRAQLQAPAALGLAGGLLAFGRVPSAPFAAIGLGACLLVGAAIVQAYVQGLRARRRAHAETWPAAMRALLRRQGRRYGGYLVHLGIVCMGVAIVGNEFYQEVRHVTLDRNETHAFGPYALTYVGMQVEDKPNFTEYRAWLAVTRRDGRALNPLQPRRNVYVKNPDAPTSEVGLRTTWREDLYVVLNGWEDGAASATFSLYRNPLMVWLWIGGVILMLGTLIAVWPHPPPAAAPRGGPP